MQFITSNEILFSSKPSFGVGGKENNSFGLEFDTQSIKKKEKKHTHIWMCDELRIELEMRSSS